MSNESKYTPGPWVISNLTQKGYRRISGDKWSYFAKVVTLLEGSETESIEGLANVRLIAVAPEILEALERSTVELKEVLREYDSYSVKCQIDQNEAIIKKAKGE